MNNGYEKRLWKVLEKDKLTDLSQFHQPGSFDEVPLFSRERDVAFLPSADGAASKILLGFALKFLKSVIDYEEHRSGYFAAITVWSLDPDPILPYLFAWCGNTRKLREKLSLASPTTSFAKNVKRFVSTLDSGVELELGEDTVTLPGETRLFIAPECPPYNGFLPLSALHKRAKAAH